VKSFINLFFVDAAMKSEKGSRNEKRMDVWPSMSIKEFTDQLGGAGYAGKRMAEAFEIYKKMLDDKKCIKFVAAAGALIAGGMRNIFVKLIRAKAADAMLFTGAILTHDLIESFGVHHYQGSSEVDDVDLAKKDVFRMYDVFLEKKGFMKHEEGIQKILPLLPQKEMSPREFLMELGKHIKDENSIIKACTDMGVDIYCPSITDSMLGFQAWMYGQNHDLKINPQLDIADFMDLVWKEDRTYGMLILGGGVPKHFVPGMMQATGNSLNYIIQITMDRPEHGGVSGMQIREAKSWGKVSPDGLVCDMRCDVTLAFPLLVANILDYLKEKD
tara:strand:+ start:763 stop:1749 length:987 start_codon:yes stop_codon:yes gene_type:complete